MNQKDKFLGFLDKVTAPATLVESIREAFLLLESEEENYECKIEFKGKDSNGTLNELIQLYNGDQSGVIVLDQEDATIPPTMSVLRGPSSASGNRHHSIEFDETADGEFAIVIRASDDYRLERARDSIKALLQGLGDLGNCGHTFDIRFYPNSPQAKKKMFQWDGDGADRIDTDSIKITKV